MTMAMMESMESTDEGGMEASDDDGMSEMPGMWRFLKCSLCMLCGSLLLTTSLFGVDITMYGFVPEGANLKKEASQDGRSAFKVSSNFDQGVTVTVDLFSSKGKVSDHQDINVSSYVDTEEQKAIPIISISDKGDEKARAQAKKALKSYVGDLNIEVQDEEAGSFSNQTLRLTVSESE